jgi:hypothetical protein
MISPDRVLIPRQYDTPSPFSNLLASLLADADAGKEMVHNLPLMGIFVFVDCQGGIGACGRALANSVLDTGCGFCENLHEVGDHDLACTASMQVCGALHQSEGGCEES